MIRKILVTGGAGFIGSEVCRALIKKKYKVTVLDDLSMGKFKNLPRNVRFIKGNILDYKTCKIACRNQDAVIHLAAKVSIRNSINTLKEDLDINLVGTINILKASSKYKLKKLIFASSMAVYQKSKKNRSFREDDKLNPISPYGISKLAAEKYIMLMSPKMGISPVILRLFNTFGPGQTPTPYVGVITIFVKNIINNKVCKIFGDGKQRRDFIHVKDVAKAIYLSLKNSRSKNEIFNVGSGKTSSILEIFNMIKGKIGKGKKIYAPKDNTELEYVRSNIEKAKKILKFNPTEELKNNLSEIINQKI